MASIREFALIVVGVFTALAAQAWWERRQERLAEDEYLQQVAADARTTTELLRRALSEEKASGASAQGILNLMRNPEYPIERSDTAVFHPLFGRYTDPRLVVGTIEALLASGSIRIVRDPEVRSAILQYVSSVKQDHAAFTRWAERGATSTAAFVNLWELNVNSPLLADAVTQLRRSPPARQAIREMVLAGYFRQRYLTRMIEATDSFVMSLNHQ